MSRVPDDRDDETYGPMSTDDRLDTRPLPRSWPSQTGYPLDMGDDETEDDYIDRMISLSSGEAPGFSS